MELHRGGIPLCGLSERELDVDFVVGDDRTLCSALSNELHDTVCFEPFEVFRNLFDVSID